MKIRIAQIFLLIFPIFSAFSFATNAKFGDFLWFLETTRGWQQFGVISQQGGASSQTQQVLDVNGLLFHSFLKERLMAKAQLNLAFTKSPMFLWTDKPDFAHEDGTLNENLRCIEFDIQAYLPRPGWYFSNLAPFAGYSFVNYSGDENYSSEAFAYNSFSGGVQYSQKINRYYSHTFYVSYSPMMVIHGMTLEDILHYINYGAEFLTSFKYVSLTLFVNFRRVFIDAHLLGFFDETKYRFNTSEVGFSFRMTL